MGRGFFTEMKKKSHRACKEKKELKARSPEYWAEVVALVPAKARNAVARVVWYDYFSQQEVPERWPHLDWYLDTFDEPPMQEFVNGLLAVGYPFDVAQRRCAWRKGEYHGEDPTLTGYSGPDCRVGAIKREPWRKLSIFKGDGGGGR